jgi:hypothetical protein
MVFYFGIPSKRMTAMDLFPLVLSATIVHTTHWLNFRFSRMNK